MSVTIKEKPPGDASYCPPGLVLSHFLLAPLIKIYVCFHQSLRLVRLGHPARVTNPRLHSICLDSILANSEEGRLADDVRRELEELFRNDSGKGGGKGEPKLRGQARTKEAKELR